MALNLTKKIVSSLARPGSMLWSQFSTIFVNYRKKNWRFSQKPISWSSFGKNFGGGGRDPQWPLTSQSHESILKENNCFFLLGIELHALGENIF
jgi:hypothetical protein